MRFEPTLHKPIPMGARVVLPEEFYGGGKGTVVGISSMHVIFNYIVLLDEPKEDSDYGTWKAISVSGTVLTGEDGTSYQLDV